MRIGIFGGSFNPVHHGHLKLAERAVEELNLDRVIFVPSSQTPLKTEALFPASLRFKLLQAALKKQPRFSVSPCEIRRGGLSFTVDTLKFFKKKFGKRATLYFLAGADTLKRLPRWKSPAEVLTLCRFVVLTRPGFSLGKMKSPAGVSFLALDALPISSSDIRKRLSQGKTVSRWMPREAAALLSQYLRKGGDSSKRVY